MLRTKIEVAQRARLMVATHSRHHLLSARIHKRTIVQQHAR